MIFTAQYRYKGPGRVDITFKTTSVFGAVFAPTEQLVYGYKYHGMPEKDYKKQYFKLLDARATAHPEPFNQLTQIALDGDKYLALVCFCPPDAFCHRLLLMEYMEAFGMPYAGEMVL